MLTNLTATQSAAYLKGLPSIREQCTRVHDLAKQGLLEHFDYISDRETQVVKYCIDIIQVGLSCLQSPLSGDNPYISVISVRISHP